MHKYRYLHAIISTLLPISALQYFIVQYLVAVRWSPAYSLAHNTISDLGNTVCGTFNARYVCSPAHGWMNASFMVIGGTMLGGAVFMHYQFARSRASAIGFGMFALGGLGAIVVGFYPENTVPIFHGIGTLLPFLIGNIGIVVLGYSLRLPVCLRLYTLCSGAIPLTALVCYASNHFLGLGEGGIERLVAYPQTVWWIAMGVYVATMKSHGYRIDINDKII